MFPDEPFAEGRGSFLRPVPMPTVDPGAAPTQSVEVSCQWLPYIRGALMQLLLQASWVEGSGDLDQTQGRVFNLIDLFTECSSSEPPFSCLADFRTSASPFGTITIFWCPASDAIGEYGGLTGYQGTVGHAGADIYNGVTLDIVLDVAVHVTDVIIGFDVQKGEVTNNSSFSIIAYDCQNSAIIGTPLTFAEMADGSGQTYHSGGTSALTNHIAVLVAASIDDADEPEPPGLVFMTTLRLNGTSVGDPCNPGGE